MARNQSEAGRGIRVFRPAVPSGLAEMSEREFRDEKHMQWFVESNIGTISPGLEFLKTEFGEVTGRAFRPDTIAFDTHEKTFVVIEYKNTRKSDAVAQAKTYLRQMKQNQAVLELQYIRNHKQPVRFKWGSMYAIAIAPEFGKFQIGSAEDDKNIELYEIKLYGDQAVTVERVGGCHVRSGSGGSGEHEPEKETSLPDMHPKKGMVPPGKIVYPDGKTTELNSWVDIIEKVAIWLINGNHIAESDCPVPAGPKYAILNTKPFHMSGRQFKRKRSVGRLFLEMNLAPAGVVHHSIKLIKTAGLEPSEFRLHFINPPT